MIVALFGFYQSSSLHLDTILYPEKAASENWWLSWGFFIVSFPAGFPSHKLEENSSEKDSEKIIFGSRWIEYVTLGLFAYGFIQYLFCWLRLFSVGGDSTLFDYWRIRGNSGATIPFYFMDVAIYYLVWRS